MQEEKQRNEALLAESESRLSSLPSPEEAEAMRAALDGESIKGSAEVERLRRELADREAEQARESEVMAGKLAELTRALGMERNEAQRKLEKQREDFAKQQRELSAEEKEKLVRLERAVAETEEKLQREQAKKASSPSPGAGAEEKRQLQLQHERQSITWKHTVSAPTSNHAV